MTEAGFRPNPQRRTSGALIEPSPHALLISLLIDGWVWPSQLRSGFWDEIHLASFTFQSAKTGDGDNGGIVISLLFSVWREEISGYLCGPIQKGLSLNG